MGRKLKHIGTVSALLLVAVLAMQQYRTSQSETVNLEIAQVAPVNLPLFESTRQFSNEAFSELYLSLPLPNLNRIIAAQTITGDIEIDAVITRIAESRGYTLQQIAQTNLNTTDDGIQLQEPVIADWQSLLAEANQQGLSMYITHGFRDVETQRVLFLQRFNQLGLSKGQILSGQYDSQISTVLSLTAPPGYSKHHSGYTIDLADATHGFFANSPSYLWLSENNFEQAKQYGFIPSYPEGVANQGPNPEAWEFVWVGKDLTFEQ